MRNCVRLAAVVAIAVGATACPGLPGEGPGGDDDDSSGGVPLGECTAQLTLELPDGQAVALDMCARASLDATFEFDPDEPPTIRTFTLDLDSEASDAFDCRLTVDHHGVCAAGIYTSNQGVDASLATLDCAGVPDEFEGTPAFLGGRAEIGVLTVGGEGGDLTGLPLPVTIEETLELHFRGGYSIRGSVAVEVEVTAQDAEEIACEAPLDGWADTLTAGFAHACATRAGAASCWGRDLSGEGSPPAVGFSVVEAGFDHTCGLETDGSVRCWGNNRWSQREHPDGTFAGLAVGPRNSCAFDSGGVPSCWGRSYTEDGLTPPTGAFAHIDFPPQTGVGTGCGVRPTGELECWGELSSFQGDGPYVHVETGVDAVCAQREGGLLECFGGGVRGEPSVPLSSYTLGNRHGCGVQADDGALVCWGDDEFGQRGLPTDLRGVHSVRAGGLYTCARTWGGQVECWGDDRDGQGSVAYP